MDFIRLFICVTFMFYNISFAKDTKPRYLHLALTGDPTEMMVGWYTEDSTFSSEVQFGTSPKNYVFSSRGISNSWLDGYGYNHFVLLRDLYPSTKYYYVCGSAENGWSYEASFQTAPNETIPFSIGIYGDVGVENSENTVKRVINHTMNGDFNWIYHVGDLGYADDHLFFQDTWNEFSSNIEPMSSTIPYMVLPGNHEHSSWDPWLYFFTRNFVVYNHRFLMPNANNQSKSMYYSFDYSNVHFISYSTETSFKGAPYGDSNNFGDQVSWIKEDLIKANLPENRQKHPWIIVGGHRPIYSSSKGYSSKGVPTDNFSPPSNSATLQAIFEDLFYEYNVDLIFNGHVHSYERNYPAYRNKRTGDYINPKSPINIVIGNGGNIEGLEDGSQDDWENPPPEWSAHRFGSDYGYGILTIHNDTHLNWKLYRASDGGIEDEVDIINYNHKI